MKNTAAPWQIDGQFDDDTTIEIISGDPKGEYITICELEPLTGEWSEEEIANARLIAAAPEAVAACRKVLAYLDSLENGLDNSIDAELAALRASFHAPLRAAIGPAIAKAEGHA